MHPPPRASAAHAQARKGADWAPARIAKKLTPPAAGTQRWLQRFGDALVTVRYRDDLATGRRAVTVELLVEERALPVPRAKAQSQSQSLEEVLVQIRYGERSLAAQARAHGGHWDPEARRWRMARGQAVLAGLGDRIDEPSE